MSDVGGEMETEPERPSRAPEAILPPRWRTNLLLFLATVASVFVTGTRYGEGSPLSRASLVAGAQFAGTLLTILVAHELGHYVMARIHRVPASLPFFIPLPFLSPFGTMGAVIRMPGAIPTRRALLDIGAAGPLAGIVFALPLYAWGAAHSRIVAAAQEGTYQLGESVMLKLLDHFFAPQVADGQELLLSPVAFGAWGGMFVTMINLLPVGQLDGGHVAYSLFGPKQDKYALVFHRAMLAFFGVAVVGHLGRDLAAGLGLHHLGRHLSNGVFWLVWFQMLAILGLLGARGRGDELAPGTLTVRTRLVATFGLVVLASLAREEPHAIFPAAFLGGFALLMAMERKGGTLKKHDLLDHPPTSAEPLDLRRAAVAIVTLLLFGLLFMPEPFSM